MTTTKAEATRMAKHLLSLLKPKFKTFKIRVWKNLGWHYAVDNNFLSVSSWGWDGGWTVMYVPHYSFYGDVIHHRNPVTAVRKALKQREDFVGAEVRALEVLKESLK